MQLNIRPVTAPALTGLTATAGVRNVVLRWNMPNDPTYAGAEVWCGSTASVAAATKLASVEGTTYTDTGSAINPTADRYYWVRAINIYQRADGAWSNSVSARSLLAQNLDIAAGAVQAGNLSVAAIAADGTLTANSVTATQITDRSITSAKIVANTITANEIAGRTITAGLIQTGAITANEIKANTITANEIWSGYVYAGTINANQINAGTINADRINTNGIQVRDASGNIILDIGGLRAGYEAPNTKNSDQKWNDISGPGKPTPGKGAAINEDPMLEDLSQWTLNNGITRASGTTAAGATGLYYLASSGNVGDNLYAISNSKYPVDPYKIYSLTAMLLAAAGNTRNMYIFVNFYDKNGTQLVAPNTNWGGSMSGYTFGGLIPGPASTFVRLGGDFGPGTGREIPTTARTMQIGVWFRYNNGTSTVEQAAQDIRLEDVNAARLAQRAADAAMARVTSISANGVLDRSEKPAINAEWNAINKKATLLEIQADGAGVSRTTFSTKFQELTSYLTGLVPQWNDTTTDTNIVRADFDAKFNNYYEAEIALIGAINAKASESETTFIADGGIVVTGGRAVKSSGTAGWNAQLRSKDGFSQAFASVRAEAAADIMFGLNASDVADSSYGTIDAAIYLRGDSVVEVYESGIGRGTYGTYTAGDVFSVQQNGTNLVYMKNGVIFRTVPPITGGSLYFDSSFHNIGNAVSNIRFGPLSSNNWNDMGGTGKPADNASADLTLIGRGVQVSGNFLTKTGATWAWDADAYSLESAPFAYALARVTSLTSSVFFGLNNDPATDSNYTSIFANFYLDGAGSAYSGINADLVQPFAVAVGDILMITYDGVNVRWFKNGLVIRTFAFDLAGTPLFFDTSFANPGATLGGCRFGPIPSALFADIGGAGKPAANATVGAPSGTNVGSTPATTVESRANGALQSNSGPSVTINGTNLSTSKANTPTVVSMGNATATVSGGVAPFTYAWTIAQSYTDPDNTSYTLSMTNDSTATVSLTGKPANYNTAIVYTLRLTVTDANQLTATASFNRRCQFGTPI